MPSVLAFLLIPCYFWNISLPKKLRSLCKQGIYIYIYILVVTVVTINIIVGDRIYCCYWYLFLLWCYWYFFVLCGCYCYCYCYCFYLYATVHIINMQVFLALTLERSMIIWKLLCLAGDYSGRESIESNNERDKVWWISNKRQMLIIH